MSVNPYAAPATQMDPVPTAFRCTRTRRILTRMVAGRKREPRFDDETKEFELYQSGLANLVGLGFLLTPVVMAIPFLLGSWASFFRVWLPMALGAQTLAVIIWFAGESVYFTDAYIRRIGPFWRKVTLRWCDLHGLKVTAGGDLVLTDHRGSKIVVHNDLHGQHALFATLRNVVPQELLDPQQNNLAELEKLLS